MSSQRPDRAALFPAPEGTTRPLRVVLVVPPLMPQWLLGFVDLAAGHEWVKVVAVVASGDTAPDVEDVPLSLRLYLAFERALLGTSGSLKPVAIAADTMRCQDDASLAAAVEGAHPDLVIQLGSRQRAAALARIAPLGCWHVDPALADVRHAGLSLLTPMLGRENATKMALMLQNIDKSSVNLAASWGRTRHTAFLKQREDAFRKLPALLMRGLHRLAGGYVPTERHCVTSLRMQPTMPFERAPGLGALWSAIRASPRWLTGWQRNGRVGWTLLLRLGRPSIDPAAPQIGAHALLKAPRGWWGDPFVVETDGRRLIFVEEMARPKLRKANIACVELVAGGARRLGVVHDEVGHLSYPQVFQWNGHWYMTLETGYDRRVSLYRAQEFPNSWLRVRDLLSGRACVDPTLHHHEGFWYLFVNIAENGVCSSDELYLYVARQLEGPYTPHPASPIVCDVRRARMAGKLFRRHGRLIRPAQDCAPGYGNAVVFNEVMELSPDAYRERPLGRLSPRLNREVDGCHTYNADGGIEVLDILGRLPAGSVYMKVADVEGAAGRGASPAPPGPVNSPPMPRPGGPAHSGGASR